MHRRVAVAVLERPGPRALLVLANSVDNQRRFRSLLGNEFDLEFAGNEDVALSIAILKPPDLVVFDGGVDLGDFCGVCRRLRSLPSMRNVPLVVLTACPVIN